MKVMVPRVISQSGKYPDPVIPRSTLIPCFPLQQKKASVNQKLGMPLTGSGRLWGLMTLDLILTQPSTPPQLPSKSENERFLSYITFHLLFQKQSGEHLPTIEN